VAIVAAGWRLRRYLADQIRRAFGSGRRFALWLRPALRAFTSLRDVSLRRNLRLSHRCAM